MSDGTEHWRGWSDEDVRDLLARAEAAEALVPIHQRLLNDVSVALGEQDVPTVDIAPAVAALRARAEAAEAERDEERDAARAGWDVASRLGARLRDAEARIDKALAILDEMAPRLVRDRLVSSTPTAGHNSFADRLRAALIREAE